MIYAMVKIDGHETLCIGGKIIADDEKPGFLWITNVQGEKILNVDAKNYRAITEAEAKEHLKQAHARREAAGEAVEIAVVNIKKASEEMKPGKKNYGFKPFPAFPEPPSKPWNN